MAHGYIRIEEDAMGAGRYQDQEYFKPDELRLSPQEQAVVTEFVRERNEDEPERSLQAAVQ